MSLLLGCDFSSSPSRRKPIVVAWGEVSRGRVQVHRLEALQTLDAFSAMLEREPAWVGGFDLPFGLPRELVQQLGWPVQWQACIAHYASLSRAEIRAAFADFCNARPAGSKFAHRATDRPAGSSPSMKWVNPPVAYMLHAGVPRLIGAGVYMPGLQPLGQSGARVALEAYPGMLARELLGSRSYKSDDKSRQTPERLIARKDLLTALELGQSRLGLRLALTHAQRDALVDDASADSLDAVLCLIQAAWAQQQYLAGDTRYGLPADTDPLEGWIVTAPALTTQP
jgi:Protein of unknown function (DUF429)